MNYSAAHRDEMNMMGARLYPDGLVPWDEAIPPDLESGDPKRTTGRPRSCAYCGSLHPSDVVAAIRVGARGSWADMKYGWPHKAYFEDVPNPHAGLLESRASANHKHASDWVQLSDGSWREPGSPARETFMGKFYTVHLLDATPEEKAAIEAHLGLHFDFTEDGQVSWHKSAGG